jgi:hypothetical protein
MTERRAPQDRLAKQAGTDEKPEGWELLKAPSDVPGWDQAEFLAVIQPLADAQDPKGNIAFSSDVLRIVAEVGVLVFERFAKDPEAFQALTSGGMPGLTRMVNVCFWYAELLGKSEDSATS